MAETLRGIASALQRLLLPRKDSLCILQGHVYSKSYCQRLPAQDCVLGEMGDQAVVENKLVLQGFEKAMQSGVGSLTLEIKWCPNEIKPPSFSTVSIAVSRPKS